MKQLTKKKNPKTAKEMALRLASLLLVMYVGFMSAYAADPAPITVKSTTPSNGDKVSYISTVRIDFGIENVLAMYPDVPASDFGIMNMTRTINIYKGENSTGEVVASKKITGVVNTSAGFVTDKLYTEITFDNDVILESNQAYCIVIPAKTYSVATLSQKYTNTVITNPIEIIVYGSGEVSDKLLMTSVSPENGETLEKLDKFTLNFNQEVLVKPSSNAILYEGDEIVGQGSMEVNENDSKSVVASFDNVVLYNSHTYKITVPGDVIYAKDNESDVYGGGSITINGSSYRNFGYTRVSPSMNRKISNLGRIGVTVDCGSNGYLGRDFKATAQLYKLGADDTRTQVGDNLNCLVNESTKGFYIDVYNFDLEPATKYEVVVAADQFHLWDMDTQRPMHDTTNSEMVFTYTTADEIEPVAPQGFGAAVPAVTTPVETLTSFRLDFSPFEYDNTFYYPVFASYTAENYNVLDVTDVTTGEKVADFTVDIKWDNDNNFWIENTSALDVNMLKGHEYVVNIPEGMFCCRFEELKDVSANKAYAVTYQGGYATSFTLTYAIEGQATLSTMVERGAEVTVTFPENDGFRLASLSYNGEPQTVAVTYTTPAVNADVTLDLTYEYAGKVDYDYSTGVEVPSDCPYSVRSEGEMLVIDGVESGDSISVYTTGGMLVATLPAVPSDANRVAISLANGDVYLIRINAKALKVRH